MIKPLVDKVLLKVDEVESTTASGLVIAGNNNEAPDTGTVIAVGEGITLKNGNKISIPVSPGDRVIFSKYSGTEVSDAGESYLLVAYKDVLAVVEND